MSSDVAVSPIQVASTRKWAVLVIWVACLAAMVWAAAVGMRWQRALWEATAPIRFQGDINNAYHQGRRADQIGLLKVYDEVVLRTRKRPDGVQEFGLDYPPLRLTGAWLWYRWTREHFPSATQWQNTWDFHWPLLMMNRAFLALAAVSAFGIVLTVRRWGVTETASQWRRSAAVIAATLAGLLCWFNPPANLIAFGWPQWDVCVPAFFLAALLAGLRRWWLLAGALLAAGGMFKGQLFVMLPLMALWPLLSGQFGGLLRLCVGGLLVLGIVAAPFWFGGDLWSGRAEVVWLTGAMLGAWAIGRIWRYLPDAAQRWRAVGLVTVAIYCGLFGWIAGWYIGAAAGVVAGAVLFILARQLNWRWQPSLAAASVALALWLPAALTPTSWAWLKVGVLYGSEHFNAMHMGLPSNLPAILSMHFGIRRPDMIALTLPWGIDVSWKEVLRGVFIAGSLLCAIAMTVHWRRRCAWLVLPAATAWMLFVTFPAQIHERYIMYAALASTLFTAIGFRWTVLHIALCLVALPPVMMGMMAGGNPSAFMAKELGPTFGPTLARTMSATFPGIGWALICLTLVSLWASMDLRRRVPIHKNNPP